MIAFPEGGVCALACARMLGIWKANKCRGNTQILNAPARGIPRNQEMAGRVHSAQPTWKASLQHFASPALDFG